MDRIEQKELDTISLKKLTKFQKKQVISLVEQFNEDNKETTKDSFHVCPKCGKDHPNITKGGKQMYLCHECGKRFVEDIGKPSYYSWYDISAWRIFIEETLQGKTLDESAEKLGIFHSTAWSWRHKRCHGVADKDLSRYCALWAKVYSLSGQDLADKVRSILGLFERKEDDGHLKTSKIKTSNIFEMAAS